MDLLSCNQIAGIEPANKKEKKMFTLSTYPHSSIFENVSNIYFSDEITRLEDGTYKIAIEVPGFAKEHVTIQTKETTLTVSLKNGSKQKKGTYRLSKSVDQDKITATCKDGILTILCPLRESVSKTVNVTVD